MGEVYRARDTRLDRIVAIKVLRDVGPAAQRERLLHEARAASALNHPNVVAVYDVGTAENMDFIVMEFVPGKPLDSMIPRHGMRLPEALKIAVQIAEALSAAHAAGIIHRDLKPANVMVTESGQVKLLDFGLAKPNPMLTAVDGATQSIPTQPSAEGTIAGTLAYMSPEQAEGKKLDARTDIFSFGALFYEMLTGERAFRGDSPASTMSAILRDDPRPATAISVDLPREVERLLMRCLRKDPERRIQSAADLRVALFDLKEESDSGRLAAAPVSVPARRRMNPAYLALAVPVVLAAIAGAAWRYSKREPVAMPATAHVRPLTAFEGVEDEPALSPDGKQVAFTWRGEKQDNQDIYVMLVSGGKPLRLTTDPAPDWSPAWSPDGQMIALLRGRNSAEARIIVVPSLGGAERVVVPSDVRADVLGWSASGTAVLYTTNSDRGIASVEVQTGEITHLTKPPVDSTDFNPRVSPDGSTLAFIRRITTSSGKLMLMPLNAEGKPAGELRELYTSTQTFLDAIDWAPDSRSVLFSTGGIAVSSILRAYLDGHVATLPLGRQAFRPSVSRTGGNLAYVQRLYDPNIWELPLGGKPRAIISSTAVELSPSYSADGKKIVFVSTRSGEYELWTADADGTNAAQLTNNHFHLGAPSFSPDGKMVAFDSSRDGHWNIYVIPSGGSAPRQLTSGGTSTNVRPTFSPDGKWVYYGSDRAGQWRIFKVSVEGGEPIQVTQKGGSEVFLDPDGKYLYYVHQGRAGVYRMPIEGGDEVLIHDKPRQSWWVVARGGIYFVDPDGPQTSLDFYSFATQKTTSAAALPGGSRLYPQGGRALAISPDGRTVLITLVDKEEGDLYLVEGFR